jgi:hypothetical protein
MISLIMNPKNFVGLDLYSMGLRGEVKPPGVPKKDFAPRRLILPILSRLISPIIT